MDLTRLKLANKRILVTGHTGFKGSWLSIVLNEIGAHLYGLSLLSNNPNSLYESANIDKLYVKEYFMDIRDYDGIKTSIDEINPDYVFHLAAQSLVLVSIKNPIDTFSTNILGTANLLEILLSRENLKGILLVTSDKVYKFNQKKSSFTETDELGGGIDPYSVSKASTELIALSMSMTGNSYLIPIATARAGNVVGGCDWAVDRLIPDLFRSVYENTSLEIRHPLATRPWQHVLDCIYGYILIAEQHLSGKTTVVFNSFNFGPTYSLSVMEVVNLFNECTGSRISLKLVNSGEYEQTQLAIDSNKAKLELGWLPQFLPEEAIRNTLEFYNEFRLGFDANQLARRDVKKYFSSLT